MAGIDVSSGDLENVTGAPVTAGEFESLDRLARGMISAYYHGDIDSATGRRAAILSQVYTTIMHRLITNPVGVANVALGSASITLEGALADSALTITSDEAALLASAATVGRQRARTFVMMSPTITSYYGLGRP